MKLRISVEMAPVALSLTLRRDSGGLGHCRWALCDLHAGGGFFLHVLRKPWHKHELRRFPGSNAQLNCRFNKELQCVMTEIPMSSELKAIGFLGPRFVEPLWVEGCRGGK